MLYADEENSLILEIDEAPFLAFKDLFVTYRKTKKRQRRKSNSVTLDKGPINSNYRVKHDISTEIKPSQSPGSELVCSEIDLPAT